MPFKLFFEEPPLDTFFSGAEASGEVSVCFGVLVSSGVDSSSTRPPHATGKHNNAIAVTPRQHMAWNAGA